MAYTCNTKGSLGRDTSRGEHSCNATSRGASWHSHRRPQQVRGPRRGGYQHFFKTDQTQFTAHRQIKSKLMTPMYCTFKVDPLTVSFVLCVYYLLHPFHFFRPAGAHPASYQIRIGGGGFPGKADGAWNWPLSFNWWRFKERVELHIRALYEFISLCLWNTRHNYTLVTLWCGILGSQGVEDFSRSWSCLDL